MTTIDEIQAAFDNPSVPVGVEIANRIAEHRSQFEEEAIAIAQQVGLPRGLPFIFLRPGEVLLFLKSTDAGVCSKTGKALVAAMLCWDHRITDPRFRHGDWKLGEDRFDVTRHADGTYCLGNYGDMSEVASTCWSQPRCPECKQYNATRTRQEAYGDRTWCTTPTCNYTSWFSIGD